MENLNDFKNSLRFTLLEEVGSSPNGGYTNNPADPGGETKWGISKRAHPSVDIKNLTREQAADIYVKEYWDASGCDSIPWPLCAVVFDSAVNCGVSRTLGWLRADPNQTPKDYIQRRRQYYIDICNKNTNLIRFAKGWWGRLGRLQRLVDTPVTV